MENQLFALQPARGKQQQHYPRADVATQEVPPSFLLPQPPTELLQDTEESLPISPRGSSMSTLPQAGPGATPHVGSASSPCGTLHPRSCPHPQNRGEFCFGRRSAAKHMLVCISAQLDLQHRSPQKDICVTQSEISHVKALLVWRC